MAAKKLSIMDKTGKIPIAINVRYEKLDREEPPVIVHKVGDNIVTLKTVVTAEDKILDNGSTHRAWVDEHGTKHQKEEVKHFYEGTEVSEKEITKIFEIVEFQPLASYTDAYVIDKYYELFADEDGHKKDFDKDIARRKNLVGMRGLWEYLTLNRVVARGELNISSAGFLATDGYIRAVSFGNKWGLEVGIFREQKVFQHLQESIPEAIKQEALKPGALKRV